ncbi:hypothetical protein TNCV_4308211, partial [Trichonephila clavipes]
QEDEDQMKISEEGWERRFEASGEGGRRGCRKAEMCCESRFGRLLLANCELERR